MPGFPDGENLMAQNQLFEMPKQLRELAEKNVEQVRAAYAQFMDAIAQAWSTAPSNVMTSGFRDVQALAIRFANENAEAGFALAKELANAKDILGVMTLQGQYTQTQLQSYGRQAHELGRLMAEAMESMKTKS
jgi:hypothetical protein